jgi:hypothetical protein
MFIQTRNPFAFLDGTKLHCYDLLIDWCINILNVTTYEVGGQIKNIPLIV